ncbi:MAG TPA: urate hydroxylase PuuD [Gemmatimonadaceae bacterium]|nr:urate hydroxylase PuuD [Gemmatimonadaceae bacterium]
MSPRALELIDLAVRWVHLIAGIMWIGNSLLFNWLDRSLEPSSAGGEGMQGEVWLLHSGGFYFVEKTMLVGRPLPRTVHWFKWQAYTTWLSGAALLAVVYYAGGRALMVDPAVAALGPGAAVALGAGSVVGGVALYNLLWRAAAPRGRGAARAAGALSLAALVGVVYALTHLLSGRAAFLHVGALLGSIMAGNVFLTIVPSQRVLVAAVRERGGSDAAVAARAKTVSIHNNYLTFPVLVLMVSSHFPGLYGHPRSWLLLLVLIAGGAAVRHVLNVRFGRPRSRWVPALAGAIAASLALLWALGRPGGPDGALAAAGAGSAPLPERVPFDSARRIVDRRCAACHSREPSDSTFGPAPAGVSFDAAEQMRALAPRIRERAVVTRTMPPANKTHITDRERALLGRWVEQGATVP